MITETCYNTSKFTITKEVELMAIEKNSLSILIGYLALMIAQMLAQKLCWGTQMLYPVLTVIGLLGALIIWKLNQKYSYQNIIEEKQSNLKKIILWGLSGALLVILGQVVTLTLAHVLFHQSLISQNTNALITVFHHSPIYLLDIVIATPIVEELIFRKIFFGNLTYVTVPFILLPLKFPPWVDLPIHGLYVEKPYTVHPLNHNRLGIHDESHFPKQDYESHHK